jgi:hypothetical protein
MLKEHFVVVLSVIEILLLVADRIAEWFNLKHYYVDEHLGWLAITLFFILLPGILETVFWVSQLACCCGGDVNCCCYGLSATGGKFWKWMAFGLFFPISIICRHTCIVSRGRVHIKTKYSNLRVLKSLQSFAESGPQTVLQGYIVIRTWNKFGNRILFTHTYKCHTLRSFTENHWIQLISILTGLLMLAKSCAEHHYHEVSGKTEIPGIKDIMVSISYYLIHVVSRTFTFILFFVHFRYCGIIPVLLLFFANLILSSVILKNNFFVKTFWTSVAAVLAPICFVSVHAVAKYSCPQDIFRRFYFWNILTYVLIILMTTLTLNIMSAYEMIELRKLELDVLTFGHSSLTKVMGYGSFTWIGLGAANSVLVLL